MSGGTLPQESTQLRTRRQTVRKVDFTRPRKFAPDLIHRLRRAAEEFAGAAALRVSAELRVPIEFEVIAARQRTWVDAHALTPEASLSTVLRLTPGANVLLAIEESMLFGAVELLMGGGSAADAPTRRMTDIDRAVGSIFIRSLIEVLAEIWQEQLGQQLTEGRGDVHSEFAQFVGGSEPTFVITLEAIIGGVSSTLDLLIPWAAIAPIAPAAEVAPSAMRADPLRGLLSKVHVHALAEVATVELPLEQVLALRPGDVVALKRPAADGVTVLGGTLPVHVALPGRSGAHRAVQIVGPAPAKRKGRRP